MFEKLGKAKYVVPLLIGIVAAVSYTHLDVYKRQEFARCAMVWAKSQVVVEPDVRIDEEDRGGSVHGRTPSSPWRSSMNSSMSWS